MQRIALVALILLVMGIAGGIDKASPAGVVHRDTIVGETRAEAAARHRLEFRHRVTPVYCGAADVTFDPGWYAIPCPYVDAESGGRGGPYCNTYGVIGGLDEPAASSRTWIDYGGLEFAPTACAATEDEQSRVAQRVWRDRHASAWAPFES